MKDEKNLWRELISHVDQGRLLSDEDQLTLASQLVRKCLNKDSPLLEFEPIKIFFEDRQTGYPRKVGTNSFFSILAGRSYTLDKSITPQLISSFFEEHVSLISDADCPNCANEGLELRFDESEGELFWQCKLCSYSILNDGSPTGRMDSHLIRLPTRYECRQLGSAW